jgi:hypothetical protein
MYQVKVYTYQASGSAPDKTEKIYDIKYQHNAYDCYDKEIKKCKNLVNSFWIVKFIEVERTKSTCTASETNDLQP